jgi:lipoate---protein ligase
VRRPSGGRAVLHQGDLTYAVVASGFSGSRTQAYQQICAFLIHGWRSLGVELAYGEAGRGYIHNPNCFGTATGADLVTPDGVKLIGSAQLRRDPAILQHGSMQLTTDPGLFGQVFGTALASFDALPLDLVIAALSAAVQDCFGIQLQIKPLTQAEWPEILAHSSQFNANLH